MGSFIPLSTSSGENLLIGNNSSASGSSGFVSADSLAPGSPAGELARDRYFREAALSWVTQNPADAVQLYLAKVANYFNPYTPPATASQGGSFALVVSWLAVLVLASLVAVRVLHPRLRPVHETEQLFIGLFFLNAPVMAVFFTRMRFRQPLDATMVVVAAVPVAVAIGSWLAHRPQRRRGREIR